MPTFAEVWKFWYDAQLRELEYHRNNFGHRPSLKPTAPFEPESDCEQLRNSMKGLGTNEEEIIKILTGRTLDQRVNIEEKYKEMYERDLNEDLKAELTGVFEKVILSLLKPIPLFLAEQVEHATKGAGTDESALIEIFCTRDDESIKDIKESFEKKFEKSMEEVVKKDTEGCFQKILLTVISSCRDDSDCSIKKVVDQLLCQDITADEICSILTARSFKFLKNVFEKLAEKDLDFMGLVEEHFSGDAKRAIETIYKSSKCIPTFFADALNRALAGLGTDDWALIRIIVSRCEVDMEDIKEKYKEPYGKDLIEKIKDDTSGDYRLTLLRLLGAEEC